MESLGKLIPIIFLVLWTIITITAKKKKKQQASQPDTDKTPKPAQKKQFLGNLQNTLENMFAELNQPPEEEFPETLKPLKSPKEEKQILKEADSETTTQKYKPVTTKLPKTKSAYSTQREKASVMSSVRKLRDAVIWSEILAKPVSMRDW